MDETMGRSVQKKTGPHSHNPMVLWTPAGLERHIKQFHKKLVLFPMFNFARTFDDAIKEHERHHDGK